MAVRTRETLNPIASLNGNKERWQIPYTSPDREHYPHVFLWDGAFVAIVRAQSGDSAQAGQEVRSILDGQDKETGFVPNMTFGPGRKADPERFTFMNPAKSSDYTQPPLLAHASLEVHESFVRNGQEDEGKGFLTEVYSDLGKYYDYLARTRTDPGSSLIAVIHPHETGRDSDPTFDFSKARLPLPAQGAPVVRGVVDGINSMLDYGSALTLNVKKRTKGWDIERAREDFWVKDIMFNAIYAQNLGKMAEIAKVLGKTGEEEGYRARAGEVSQDIVENMWSPSTDKFHALNVDGKKYKTISVSNLFPLILDATSPDQVDKTLKLLEDPDMFDAKYPIPSVPLNVNEYDGTYSEKRLWRGPVWMNMNWYITEGLIMQRDRFQDQDPELAERLNARALIIAEQSAKLIKRSGYREFYNPKDGRGYRVKNFAWSTLGYLLAQKVDELRTYAPVA